MGERGAARLRMSGVVVRFGATLALDGVELEVRAGEVHALVGENGAGKSTLMRVLAGALRAERGALQLDGRPYAPRHPSDARRAGVAMIFQELSLAPHLSVAENVLLGVEPTRYGVLDWSALRRRARELLAQVGRPELDVDRPAATLALAERQLVEIARALALDARVLVLDEPSSSLARADVERLFALLRGLKQRGVAIVYISHVLEEVFEIAERFTVLRDGRTVASGALADVTPAALIAAMVGREVSELYPRSEAAPGAVVARLEHIGLARTLRDASLELRRGEVLGIAGLDGAGRTELLRALFGLEGVVRGELRVLALDGPRAPRERWRQGVGLLSEDRQREGLALARPVAENLCLPRLDALGALGCVTPAALERAAALWIERLRIKCAGPAEPVASLSGGNQQKVALARLLFADVDVLLLDEPTRGVDVGAKAEIYALVDQLARGERRCAVLVVSSYLPELFGICDRIAVMTRGVLGPARAAADIDERDVMRAATGGAA